LGDAMRPAVSMPLAAYHPSQMQQGPCHALIAREFGVDRCQFWTFKIAQFWAKSLLRRAIVQIA